MAERRQGGVMAAAADSKSAIREYVRVRVPLLAPAFSTDETTGEVSEWSMVQPWKGCVGASPPGVYREQKERDPDILVDLLIILKYYCQKYYKNNQGGYITDHESP